MYLKTISLFVTLLLIACQGNAQIEATSVDFENQRVTIALAQEPPQLNMLKATDQFVFIGTKTHFIVIDHNHRITDVAAGQIINFTCFVFLNCVSSQFTRLEQADMKPDGLDAFSIGEDVSESALNLSKLTSFISIKDNL